MIRIYNESPAHPAEQRRLMQVIMAVNFNRPAQKQTNGVFYAYAVLMDNLCATNL
jgi:hypothetical protein